MLDSYERLYMLGKIFKSKKRYIAPFIEEIFDFKTNKKSTTENAHKKHVLFHTCTFSDANEKTSVFGCAYLEED